MGIPLDCKFQEIQDLYNCLGDEKSKEVFRARLNYNISRSLDTLQGLIATFVKLPPIDMPLIIFGADTKREALPWMYPNLKRMGYKVPYIWDNNSRKWNKPLEWRLETVLAVKDPSGWDELMVLPPRPKSEMGDQEFSIGIMVSDSKKKEKLRQQLFELGYQKEQIYLLSADADFYFDETVFSRLPDRFFPATFVDGGAYDGATSMQFRRWSERKCLEREAVHKIYAFEPDRNSYELCKKYLAADCQDKAECIQKGLWSSDTVLSFLEGGEQGSRVLEGGLNASSWTESPTELPVMRLDSMQLDVSNGLLIKMDLEGSELDALHGAEQTIVKYRPVLVICLYHKPEDVLTIPVYLNRILKDYQIYLRHYSIDSYDTVLYAIPKELL